MDVDLTQYDFGAVDRDDLDAKALSTRWVCDENCGDDWPECGHWKTQTLTTSERSA